MMTGRSRAPPPEPADKSDAIIDLACKSAWKEVDPNLEGKLSAEQFKKVMGALGQSLSEAELEEAVRGDGISCEYSNVSGKRDRFQGRGIADFVFRQ